MSNIELRITNVEVGSPPSHFSIQHSVFTILRFPLSATSVVTLYPSGPGPYGVTGEAAEAGGPPQETIWSAAGLRGIFAGTAELQHAQVREAAGPR